MTARGSKFSGKIATATFFTSVWTCSFFWLVKSVFQTSIWLGLFPDAGEFPADLLSSDRSLCLMFLSAIVGIRNIKSFQVQM